MPASESESFESFRLAHCPVKRRQKVSYNDPTLQTSSPNGDDFRNFHNSSPRQSPGDLRSKFQPTVHAQLTRSTSIDAKTPLKYGGNLCIIASPSACMPRCRIQSSRIHLVQPCSTLFCFLSLLGCFCLKLIRTLCMFIAVPRGRNGYPYACIRTVDNHRRIRTVDNQFCQSVDALS